MKKILIFTSKGGGGHVSASNALKEHLQSGYQIEIIYLFNDLLTSLDTFKKITFNRYSGEELYNLLLRKQQCFLITLIFFYFGSWYVQHKKKYIHSILLNYLQKNIPDLIISVIPCANNIILSVCQELAMPFILMPTDLDINLYVYKITHPTYSKFRLCLPFEAQEIRAFAHKASIPKELICITGAPLNSSFLTKKNSSNIKESLSIAENKPVIMLLMGAQGSAQTITYAQALSNLKHSVHLIICVGKNSENKGTLSKIKFPKHISVSLIDFTDTIADLMSLSTILITKSGSISVCEGIYMNVPLLLDATSTVLPWERFNHYFIQKHQLGESITHYKHITQKVDRLLKNPTILATYKKNMEQFKKENIKEHIKECVKKLI